MSDTNKKTDTAVGGGTSPSSLQLSSAAVALQNVAKPVVDTLTWVLPIVIANAFKLHEQFQKLPQNMINFFIGFVIGIKAFTAAVLGGIGSLPGAMLGGLLLGLAESLFSGFIDVDYKDVFAFSILIIVLIFKPSGLLGTPEVEKVS